MTCDTDTKKGSGVNASETTDVGLRTGLLARLKEIDYLAFERVVCALLEAMEYERVELLGRTRIFGRNRNGGADVSAIARTGVTITRIMIQVKQYDTPVHARCVHELRGMLAAADGGQGIIVSTAEFSPVAVAAAKASGLLPVRLIGGEMLARLLIRYRIGVRPILRAILSVDEPYFARLKSQSKT